MTALQGVPARLILAAIADAAARWCDADFPPRVRALDRIVERTGYAVPAVEYALDRLFTSISRPALEAVVASELGSIDALDGFVGRPGRPDAHARAAGIAAVISSRTTIGVALFPAVFALCAKCDVVVKDREDALIRAFFSTLAEELDECARGATALEWNGESESDLREFDAVVAFGNDGTIERIRAALSPGATFVAYGSKASAGYIGREALRPDAMRDIADGAARDLVLYETEGCMSLHVLFVEREGDISPREVATHIASAIERASVEFPPGRYDAFAGARLANARNLAAFRAASGSGAVFSDDAATYLVVLDPPLDEPPMLLPRALAIYSVDSPDGALRYLETHALGIEAVAVAGSRKDIVQAALHLGAHRITAFGELQRPPLAGGHGGRARISDFVRWVTREV